MKVFGDTATKYRNPSGKNHLICLRAQFTQEENVKCSPTWLVQSLKISDAIESHAEHVEVVGSITKKEPVIMRAKKLAKATLEDETGSITLNLWRDQTDQCPVGDTVKIKEDYAKFHRGELELNTWEKIEVLCMHAREKNL